MNKRIFIIHLLALMYLVMSCNRTPLNIDEVALSNGTKSKAHFNAANNASDLLCGTNGDVPNQAFEKNLSAFSRQALLSNTYCIKIVFYIVRDNNGVGGFNAADIPTIMRNLNDAYNPHNIFLYHVGVEYINNSTYVDLDVNANNNEFPGLISSKSSSNAINFYLVNSIFSSQGSYAGMAENIPSRNLVVANQSALSTTSAHEVGHCLNLFHTHRGPGEGGCAEAPNGSNCSSCGDYVCDTPADPGLGSGNVDFSTCTYIGGNGFYPAVNNIMSYAAWCRDRFTNGQATRLLAALAGSSVLQPIINTNCNIPTISGPNTVCNATLFSLNNVPANTSVSWDASPGGLVTLSNQSTNGVTVQQNSGQSGSIVLRARINYADGNRINITKIVELPGADVPLVSLNPSSMQCMTMGSNRYFYAGDNSSGSFQNISNNPNVAEVDWQILDYSTSPATSITNFQKYSNTVINSSISLTMPNRSSDYVITIVPRLKHKCGAWGEWGPGHSYFIKRNCASSFNALDVSYNSSDRRHKLSFSESYREVEKAIFSSPNMKSKLSNNFDIHVYDSSNKEVFSKKSARDTSILLPRLSTGTYSIELLKNGYIYRQSLEVK
ncbi:M43 family zinc metalloprotease [Sphingobacterium ginsenosidimutans]